MGARKKQSLFNKLLRHFIPSRAVAYRISFPQKRPTICPGRSDQFNIVSYYIKLVTTSWTHSILLHTCTICYHRTYVPWRIDAEAFKGRKRMKRKMIEKA